MIRVWYRIDSSDRLIAVSDSWDRFAAENTGTHLLRPSVLGQSLWEYISDQPTILVYRQLLDRVRATGGPIRFPFRCDAAAARRELQMAMTSAPNGEVTFEVTSLSLMPRPPVALLDPATPRGDGLLKMCGWCKRVLTPTNTWVELDEAVGGLPIFVTPTAPRITHGMCPECSARMLGILQAGDGTAA